MPADHDEQGRVEAACAELAAAGQPVTFAEVAARHRRLLDRLDLLIDQAHAS